MVAVTRVEPDARQQASLIAGYAEPLSALRGFVAGLGRGRGEVLIIPLGPDLAEEELATASRAAAAQVGTFLPQDATGSVRRDIYARHEDASTHVRYSASNGPAPMHTDGMHIGSRPTPAVFTLTCVAKAPVGGELHCMSLQDVLETWPPDRTEYLDELRRPFWFHSKGADPDGAQAAVHPILEGDEGEELIRYAREYIELGHTLDGAPPLTESARTALDVLDQALTDVSLHATLKLVEGDIAMFDNFRVLHARSPFQESPTGPRRRMMRQWIHVDRAGAF
jgi:alpha-ketoglutarate-dependent taurine dioxygenase